MAEPFVNFEGACKDLGVGEEQMKDLISRGDLRAFSDAGTFKFRRTDLDAYKKKHPASEEAGGEEPLVILPEMEDAESLEAVAMDAAEIAEEEPTMGGPSEETMPLLQKSDPMLLEESAVVEATPPSDGEADLTDTLTDAQEISLEDLAAEDEAPKAAPPRPPSQPKKGIPAPSATEEISLEEVGGPVDLLRDEEASSATEELRLSDEVGLAPTEDIAGEGVTSQITRPIDLEDAGMTTDPLAIEGMPEAGEEQPEDLAAPKGGIPRSGLLSLSGVRQRKQGHPAWAVLMVLTGAGLAFTGAILLGYPQRYVPGYLDWALEAMPPTEAGLANPPPERRLPPLVAPLDLLRDFNVPSEGRERPPETAR
ncbi:MAG: hypothetical protein HY608_07910 [Planctomycetes bacterium]|nr:hypothetical protein [Planctomycetota bacterium]